MNEKKCKIKNGWCKGCGKSEAPSLEICFFDDSFWQNLNSKISFRPLEKNSNKSFLPIKSNGNKRKSANYFIQYFPELIIEFEVIEGKFIKCHYCSELVPLKKITRDHKTPKKLGGTLTPENIVPACSKCNFAKADIPYERFINSRRVLPEGLTK